MRIHRIGVLSTAKVVGILAVPVGFLVGLYSAITYYYFVGGLQFVAHIPWPVQLTSGPLAVVVMPILYGLLGAVAGVAAAIGYNLIARMLGGVQVELKTADPTVYTREFE